MLKTILDVYFCNDITESEKVKGGYLSTQNESHVICSYLPLY
jgi:hypothetical protein